MGRPAGGYYLDGKRIPSVTTIISRFKPAGGLIHWAWQQGVDGKDYRETRDKAADAGTIAHSMVEADIHGHQFNYGGVDAEVLARAEGAFQAYKEWKAQTNLRVAETEVSLVSREYRFGGTLDAMFIREKLSLGDWKTSNAIYPDYLIQLGAYALLWEEHYPERPIQGGFHLLRFNKADSPSDPVAFSHHYWSDLELAKKQFLLFREAYELDQRLSKLI